MSNNSNRPKASAAGSIPAALRAVPYGHRDLSRLFSPRSIAIVGISDSPTSAGFKTLPNLKDFKGPIYLINPRRDEISGRRCYKSLSDLPSVPDCVIVAVPQAGVVAVVEECAALGVGGAIVYSAGFSEIDSEESRRAQARVLEVASTSGLKVVGPNCQGIFNFVESFGANFSKDIELRPPTGNAIGIVTQSGAMAISLHQGGHHGVSFSHLFATGNGVDVDIADCISYLANDDNCRAIACVFEGVVSPERLVNSVTLASEKNKTVVFFKIAKSDEGALAAKSHTGALAGSHELYCAALERAGGVQAPSFEHILEMTSFFAKMPGPKSEGVAVIASSGGFAILAADAGAEHGVPLPQPHTAALEKIAGQLPSFGTARNPLDLTGALIADPVALSTCADALLGDANFGALVMPITHAYDLAFPRIKIMNDLGKAHAKAACVVWTTEWLEGPGAELAESLPNVALFRSMNRCFETIAVWNKREKSRSRIAGQRRSPASASISAKKILDSSSTDVVGERLSKRILAEYQIPVTEELPAKTVSDAKLAAQKIGLPVVLKLDADVAHKTEFDVVRLGLATPDDVGRAFDEIMRKAENIVPKPRVDGVLVQKMIPKGIEIILGGRIDPQFGPVLLVGLGGIFVEIAKDIRLDLCPVSPARAVELLTSLRAAKIFEGVRGQPPIDVEKLAQVVSRFSECLYDLRNELTEADVNPIICGSFGNVAVDGLFVRVAKS